MSNRSSSQPQFSGSVALVLNGAIHDLALIKSMIQQHDYCIAVDGGLVYCEQMGICPDWIIGDFDSVPSEILAKYSHIPCTAFAVDKDKSDAELAIELVNHPDVMRITLFSALEKRTDHTLANLYLLQRFADKVIIEAELETIYAVQHKCSIACAVGQTISLIPLGECRGITTDGLKWKLSQARLNEKSMSLSNICLQNEITIAVDSGLLLCCLIRENQVIPT